MANLCRPYLHHDQRVGGLHREKEVVVVARAADVGELNLRGTGSIGRYKIFFHVEAFVHESVIAFSPPTTCIAHTIAVLLHDYCAIYDTPPTPLVYAIHHTILVMAISCKGQREQPGRMRPATGGNHPKSECRRIEYGASR